MLITFALQLSKKKERKKLKPTRLSLQMILNQTVEFFGLFLALTLL